MPYNPSNMHWLLVAMFVKDCKIAVIDPMHNNDWSDARAVDVGKTLFAKKFHTGDLSVVTMDRITQKDSISCGVLVCYYAQQLCAGGNLTLPIDVANYRKTIYTEIRGVCLEGRVQHSLCKVCKQPWDTALPGDLVTCSRCGQVHHKRCLEQPPAVQFVCA